MNRYFATFPAGCYDIIVKHLKSFDLNDLKIIKHDNSSVLFGSSFPVEKLIELRYFTNVYIVFDDTNTLSQSVFKGKSFRLIMIKSGTPRPLDVAERARLESKIKRDFNLEPNTHLSQNNFYLIERDFGKRLLTLKLSRAKFKRKKPSPGELRPELAHILCLTAGIQAKHIIVDMFAGHGSIPYEAVRGFGCKQVIAVDNQRLSNRHEHQSIKWHEADSRNLAFLADNSIDRVVTDPPWGIYDAGVDDLYSLYRDFTKEMARVLRPGGVSVVISGYDKTGEIFEQLKKLKLIGKWNVLVSGKKATIYKLQKVR